MKKSIFILVSLLAVLNFVSCRDQDEIYKQWVIPGGRVYPEKANGLSCYAGYNRIMLKWAAPKDPSVQKAIITWNSGNQSMEINYSDYQNTDTVKVYIANLEEHSYTFEIKNHDNQGNVSMSSEISKAPYAANWLASCSERSIISAEEAQGIGTVTTGFTTDNMVCTEYRYINTNGEVVLLEEKQINDRTVSLPNAKPGTRFEYRSYYVPNEGLDTICNEWRKSPTPIAGLLDKSGFKASATDTRSGYNPMNIFDGIDNNNTGSWRSGNTTYPKFVFIDLQKDSYMLNRIHMVGAVYASPIGYNNSIELYWGMEPFEATLGDTNYASLPAFAKAKEKGNFKAQSNGNFGGFHGVDASFGFTNTRYACLVFLNAKSGTNNITEVYIYGYDNSSE